MNKCSTSLPIKEMKMETTLRFHLNPIRIAIKKTSNINSGEDFFFFAGGGAGNGILIHCWWECKLVQPL
jgi:hypothetical protein